MSEERYSDLRQRMLKWAARARTNPNFDVGERDYRLAIARLARGILDPGSDQPLVERIESLRTLMGRRRVPQVVLPRHLVNLRDWAAEDERGLARALETFNRLDVPPEDRIVPFLESVGARVPADDGRESVALVLGSLFNFATTPGTTPVLRLSAFHGLEQFLGEPAPDGPLRDRYAHHLGFAQRMHEAFSGAGIPVRDMIDTEALMLVCWEDHQFWVDDRDRRRPRERAPDHYLAACAIYRDEAPYLAEWIEFHRLVGVERFYLYDNRSEDNHLEVLAPYVEEGIVVIHDWPMSYVPGQTEAYHHCLAHHGDEARWIGFFDIDEFLFSPTNRPVAEVLTEYEQWPGVVVNAPRFGPSGHRTKPVGLVIESYVVHMPRESDRTVKSIVDPAAAESPHGAHLFNYRCGSAVDENGFPVHHNPTKVPSFQRLRLNHYYWKSEEEHLKKQTHRASEQEWKQVPDKQHVLSPADRRQLEVPIEELARLEAERGVRDETILIYAEPVREALAARAKSVIPCKNGE
jgi:hypothetical protein